jgi:hypothetical protein
MATASLQARPDPEELDAVTAVETHRRHIKVGEQSFGSGWQAVSPGFGCARAFDGGRDFERPRPSERPFEMVKAGRFASRPGVDVSSE